MSRVRAQVSHSGKETLTIKDANGKDVSIAPGKSAVVELSKASATAMGAKIVEDLSVQNNGPKKTHSGSGGV